VQVARAVFDEHLIVVMEVGVDGGVRRLKGRVEGGSGGIIGRGAKIALLAVVALALGHALAAALQGEGPLVSIAAGTLAQVVSGRRPIEAGGIGIALQQVQAGWRFRRRGGVEGAQDEEQGGGGLHGCVCERGVARARERRSSKTTLAGSRL
jgi:hypothetical protein